MLSNNIKQLRKAKGINQQQLADKTGVRRETIIRLEQNKYNPSLELAMKICYVLNSDINSTFTLFDNQINKEHTEEPKQIVGQIEMTEDINIPSNRISEELINKINNMDYSEFSDLYISSDRLLKKGEITQEELEFIELVDECLDDITEQYDMKEWTKISLKQKQLFIKQALNIALNI